MNRRILLVEDNDTNLDLMSYLLRALGYHVTCAKNGRSGLECAQTDNFDLVLTDILMPDVDGYELAKRFKADEALKRVPVVAVTALAMTGDRDRILAAGFDGYISKPIDPQKFGSQIESYLKAHGVGDGPNR